MGNLCGKPESAAGGGGGEAYASVQDREQLQPSSTKQPPPAPTPPLFPQNVKLQQGTAESPQPPTAQPPGTPSVPVSAAPPQVPSTPLSLGSEISDILHAAHLELKSRSSLRFEDHYELNKIIGHGAFAKVSICTHLRSQRQFAVKAVQKNLEDTTGKQREGGCL